MLKLKDIELAGELAAKRQDMIALTNLLARPEATVTREGDDRKQLARRSGHLLKRSVKDSRYLELHDDFIGRIPPSTVIHIVDLVNSMAQSYLDKEMSRVDQQLTNLGVNTK